MQLNKFTDYALRVLMYVAPTRDVPYTIAEIATQLNVSENHLTKVVHFLAKQHWLITTRGKGGGIRLDPQVLTLRLGDIVRILQGDAPIVDCYQPQACLLLPRCGLKGILQRALAEFYHTLNRYTFAEALSFPSNAQHPLGIEILNV